MRADENKRSPLSADEIGAFLNISSSAVRHIVRREGIGAVGKRGRAKLYWVHEIAQVVGAHDRGIRRKRRILVSQ